MADLRRLRRAIFVRAMMRSAFVLFVVDLLGSKGADASPSSTSTIVGEERIAMLSVATPNFVSKVSASLASKECYCLKHGYHWILHVEDHLDLRSPHWIRVRALRETLPFYDWIFYSDADTFVTNSEVRMEAFVRNAKEAFRKEDPPFLIVQDGMEINSGGFFIRNSPQAFRFLEDWWNLGKRTRNYRFAISTFDQVPFVLTLLRYAQESVGLAYSGVCEKRYWMSYNMFVGCWSREMQDSGLDFGNRSHSMRSGGASIHYYLFQGNEKDANRGLRGFNNIYTVGDARLSYLLHPARVWRPNDFIAHVTHSMTDSTEHRSRSLVAYFLDHEFLWRCPNSDIPWPSLGAHRDPTSSCAKEPCVQQLWWFESDAADRINSLEERGDDTNDEKCAASFGALVNDSVCCGQSGVISSAAHVCSDPKRPRCVNYIEALSWGVCVPARDDWDRSAATKGYLYPNRWHGYAPSVSKEALLLDHATRDSACPGNESTRFLHTTMLFKYPGDGRTSTTEFRMHRSENFPSRLLDFINEAASFEYFWNSDLLTTRGDLRASCMRVSDGISAEGRFNPADP